MNGPPGISRIACYVPKWRLARKVIAEANAWFSPGATAAGERTVANWDEDPITMAAAAVRKLTHPIAMGGVAPNLWFASTTAPFADRSNAGVIAKACGLGGGGATLDIGGSLRAGTSSLLAALEGARPSIVVASDRRVGRPGSAIEANGGDASVAIATAAPSVARLVGARTQAFDFVDHFRDSNHQADYSWEERWVRDEGMLKLISVTVRQLLEQTGTRPDQIKQIVIPVTSLKTAAAVAGSCGLAPSLAADTLGDVLGDAGCALSLLQFAHTLARSQSGDLILLVGFGQGVDVLLFEAGAERPDDVRQYLKANRFEWPSYLAFLAHRGQVEPDWGMRGEVDNRSSLSALWRNSDAVTGMIGGRCVNCGTVQYPKSRICVNPACHANGAQEDLRLADCGGRVMSFTVDNLAFSPMPPAVYGAVQLDNGARLFTEFADCGSGKIAVGDEVSLAFRVKDFDLRRGFRRYCWKAVVTSTTE